MQKCLTGLLIVAAISALPGCSWYQGFAQRTGANASNPYAIDRAEQERTEAREPD